ncbi:MAG: TIGR04076 family protein [Candidatus Hermodarchaeota archaeon]
MKLPKIPKIKITVIKKYRPEEVFGHEMRQSSSGEKIPPCQFFEEGQEFITNSFTRPEEFCGWAWRDLTVRFTKFDLVDEDWPEPGMTYVACGDGLRPVIFKLEKLD